MRNSRSPSGGQNRWARRAQRVKAPGAAGKWLVPQLLQVIDVDEYGRPNTLRGCYDEQRIDLAKSSPTPPRFLVAWIDENCAAADLLVTQAEAIDAQSKRLEVFKTELRELEKAHDNLKTCFKRAGVLARAYDAGDPKWVDDVIEFLRAVEAAAEVKPEEALAPARALDDPPR